MIDQQPGFLTIASPWFSRVWRFTDRSGLIAQATRNVARRTSRVNLASGEEWTLMPDGWGRIRLVAGDSIIATADRLDFFGRRWELHGNRFSYQLESESMVRRHWTIGPIGSPFATLRGGLLSFNTMTLDSGLAIPLEAVVLAWQAIVRPWEATATGFGPSE